MFLDGNPCRCYRAYQDETGQSEYPVRRQQEHEEHDSDERRIHRVPDPTIRTRRDEFMRIVETNAASVVIPNALKAPGKEHEHRQQERHREPPHGGYNWKVGPGKNARPEKPREECRVKHETECPTHEKQ